MADCRNLEMFDFEIEGESTHQTFHHLEGQWNRSSIEKTISNHSKGTELIDLKK